MDAYLRPEVAIPFIGLIAAVLTLWYTRLMWLDQRRKGPEVVFTYVDRALSAALCANGSDTLSAARRFVSIAKLYLDPLLDVGGGAKSALDSIEKSLKGKIKEPIVPPIGSPGVILIPAATSGAAAEAVSTPGLSIATASADSGGYHLVVARTPPGSPPPPPATSTERDATTDEHVRAVRLALEAFADFWRQGSMASKLRAAQNALLIRHAIRIDERSGDHCVSQNEGFRLF